MRVSNINRDILRQTTQQLDQTIFTKFPKLAEWLDGTVTPTLKQLVKYAKTVDIPFGYFFLEEMPIKDTQIPHYRTAKDKEAIEPSKNLVAILDIIEERQIWAKDLLVEYGTEPLPFAGKYTVESSEEEVLQEIYTLLGIKDKSWASQFASWEKAFRYLIEQTEKAGIFVVVNGVVGYNTRRKLEVEEFRGFVLYDNIAPFVFINGRDATAAKSFTLIHEIVHVLIGESASFNLSFKEEEHNRIEYFCNQIAAKFLVPEQQLFLYLDQGKSIEQLARIFKVSQIVIARRLLDLKLMKRDDFFMFYKNYKKGIPSIKKSKGGDFYKSAAYKVSGRFFQLINTSLLQGNIQPTDAFRLTGLKAKTYDTLIEKLNN